MESDYSKIIEDKSTNDLDEDVEYDVSSVPEIHEPFDPKSVDVQSKTMIIANIVDRLINDEIELEPEFQRRSGIWDDVKQSRLIESMLIRIPLPTFYFDAAEEDRLIVVDGLQRLNTIKRFMATSALDRNCLKLVGMEYLQEYNGYGFEELPKQLQRRLRETEILTYVIKQGTPDNVRNSIFTRINTGGMELTEAEIRNAVYRGKAANLLKELARSEAFLKATGGRIKPDRMMDCEFVNRFLAFYLLGVDAYQGNLEEYMRRVLDYLKGATDDVFEQSRCIFYDVMKTSERLFGEHAFRRRNKKRVYGRINKPLFECVTVCLAMCTKEQRLELIENKTQFLNKYEQLFDNDEFLDIISNATAKIENVRKRIAYMQKVIDGENV